jgi:uncharacterized protein DUF29
MNDYDLDIYAWSQRQGAMLRRLAAGERVNDADLDWPNIAEEIEAVGRSERRAVASRITNIIEHLIKLEASPATEPRAGWRATIERSRIEIEGLLQDSPSLKSAIRDIVMEETQRARRLANSALKERGETACVDVRSLSYSEDQVFGDWFPGEP